MESSRLGTDFNIRPSFMCTITLNLDEYSVAVPQEVQDALNIPGIIPSLHASYIRNKYGFSASAISRRIQPIKCTVMRNSHMTADECEVSFLFRNLPFKPKQIKAAVVQVFAGCIGNSDYQRGVRMLATGDQVQPLSVVRQVKSASLFTGIADSISKSGIGSGSIVTFKARDLTMILLDAKVPTPVLNNLPDLDMRLDTWVAALISNHGVARSMFTSVEFTGGHSEQKALDSEGIPQSRVSVKKKKRTKRPKLFAGMTYWDLIVDVCVGAGYIPNVKDTTIYLRKATAFYGEDTWKDANFVREFDGKQSHIRKMAVGHNVSDTNMERKLNNSSVPVIKIVSSVEGKTVSAVYPTKDPTKQQYYNKSGDQNENKILVVPIGGTANQKTMYEMARYLWEKIARQEFTASISTSSMFSIGGAWDDPDLLYLDPSDAIEFIEPRGDKFKAESLDSEIILRRLRESLNMSSGEDVIFERAAVAALKGMSDSEIMRVSDVTHSFDMASSKYECTIGLHNWYEVVLDAVEKKEFEDAGVVFGASSVGIDNDAPDGGVE